MKTRCWNCGRENDCVASPFNSDEVPKNNDVTMCIRCGSLAIFVDSFPDAIRKPSPSEKFELLHNKEVQRLIVAWVSLQQRLAEESE